MSPGTRPSGRIVTPKSATRAPPNTHPNPLSGWSEDRPDPDDIEAAIHQSNAEKLP